METETTNGPLTAEARQRAFECGHEAFGDGERLADNPWCLGGHRHGPAEKAMHAAWADGWLAARDDADERQGLARAAEGGYGI